MLTPRPYFDVDQGALVLGIVDDGGRRSVTDSATGSASIAACNGMIHVSMQSLQAATSRALPRPTVISHSPTASTSSSFTALCQPHIRSTFTLLMAPQS